MKKIKRKFFISVLFLLILFIGLVFLLPTKANSTENIVPEKIEKVKKNGESKKEEKQEQAVEEVQEPVTTKEQPIEEVSTPAPYSNVIAPYPHSDFKTYMYASAVTNTASAQYQLISQQNTN